MAAGTDPIIELSHCLEDVTYPHSRAGLLAHARARGASASVQELLHQFPDWQYGYGSRQEVMQALSEVRLRGEPAGCTTVRRL